jgi:hypothetical protein
MVYISLEEKVPVCEGGDFVILIAQRVKIRMKSAA